MALSNNRIPGVYRRSLDGHLAFCPDPLPPANLNIASGTLRLIEEATHLLGQVEMCRNLVPNATLLTYSSLRREAIASSTIEGTIASPDELVLLQVPSYRPSDSTIEVANYISALEWGCEELKHRPIATNFLLRLNGMLLSGARGHGSSGRLKSHQNFLGRGITSLEESELFVPALPGDVPTLLADLERYINLENMEQRLVQCALVHYQFETIHPFADGNGRVGRLLIILHLIQLGLLSAPLIYPSVYFERSRDRYISCLQNIRDNGDWPTWITYFTQGLITQCHETIQFTQGLDRLRRALAARVQDIRKRVSLLAVLDGFFNSPVMTIKQISEQIHVSPKSVNNAVSELMTMNLLREISGHAKGRIFVCPPLMELIYGGFPH